MDWTDKEQIRHSQWMYGFCTAAKNWRATSCFLSFQRMWISPPPPVPSSFLSAMPASSSPSTMSTLRSPGLRSDHFLCGSPSTYLCSLAFFAMCTPDGMIIENICLPVQYAV